MKKKVLIIENRTQRQKQFLSLTDINLNDYPFIHNKIGKLYDEFKENLLKDTSILNEYEVIISHRSAFEKDNKKVFDLIRNYCERSKKYFILFSGGLSTSYYSKEPYEQLSLNSKDFYSLNLKLFLDEINTNDNINLLLLAFGEKWELNIVLNSLEKINSLSSDEIEEFDDFNEFYGINLKTLKGIIYFDEFNKEEEVSIEIVKQIKQKILNYINNKLGIYYE